VLRNIYKIVCLLSFFVLISCATDSDDAWRAIYNNSYDSWKQSGVKSYIFNYEATGFLPLRGVWEIQVDQSELIHVAYLGSDSPTFQLTIESAPTIESLYEDVKDCIDARQADVTKLVFDERNSIPIEFSCSNFSEGYGFRVSEFRPL